MANNTQHPSRPAQLVAALLVMLGTAGLSACGSDQTVTVNDSTTITRGRELTDLLRARQEGAITEDEYERVRRVILRRPS